MAQVTLNIGKLYLKNKTAAEWTTQNTVLGKGEPGVEIDSYKIKVGDGVKKWSELPYAGVAVGKSGTNGHLIVDGQDIVIYTLPQATATVLGGLKSATGAGKVTVGADGTASVESVGKLSTARNISLTGDATGSAAFDGSANSSITVTLANSGVVAGTFTKVTVDNKGRVTRGAALTADDITGLLGTAATKNVGTAAGQVPILGANGKLADSVIPSLAIHDTFMAASADKMLALTAAQKGDICIRTDEKKTYILNADPSSKAENWVWLRTPDAAVTSVNGQVGAVILNTDGVREGTTNLYFTQARFDDAFSKKASTALSDGDHLLKDTDTYILNCGN